MTVASPEDHQGTHFTYRFASGKTVTLPKFAKIMTFGRARKMRKLDEAEQMFALMEEICDEDALAVVDDMGTDETEAFFSAWQADSGVTSGESQGSSGSSTSTAGPLSTTSATVSTYP